MTGGAARPTRRWLGLAGGVLVVVACATGALGVARGSELAVTGWFSVLALVAPALVVLGAPWSLGAGRGAMHRWADRLASSRRERRGLAWSVSFLTLDIAAVIFWRLPLAVDALVRHPALVLAEAVTLVAAGMGLWLELVESPPLVPRSSRPRRALLAALAMWSVWIVAYLEGMSSRGWYGALHHVAGVGLSAAADRQASAVVLWATAAAVFMPVVFWNLSWWLRSESDEARPAAGEAGTALAATRALGAVDTSR
jgi:cytochrome c oxidase assembly factor CtaG